MRRTRPIGFSLSESMKKQVAAVPRTDDVFPPIANRKRTFKGGGESGFKFSDNNPTHFSRGMYM